MIKMKKKGNLKDPSPPPLKKINWPKISLESIKTIWRIDSIDHFLSEDWAVHSYSGLSKQVFVILPSWLPDSRRGTRAGGAKYRRARFHERARFQRWLEQECGHHHGTLERAESSEIAANRSPPGTGLAHSTYVQVTTAARSSTFTALPSREESATTIPLSLSIISRNFEERFVRISSFGELRETWREEL